MNKNIIFAKGQRSSMIKTLGEASSTKVLNWIRSQPASNKKGRIPMRDWDRDIDFSLTFKGGLIYFGKN